MQAVGDLTRPQTGVAIQARKRSEEHTSELQSRLHLVCRLLLEKKKKNLHYLSEHYSIPTARPHNHEQLSNHNPTSQLHPSSHPVREAIRLYSSTTSLSHLHSQ